MKSVHGTDKTDIIFKATFWTQETKKNEYSHTKFNTDISKLVYPNITVSSVG